MRNEVIGVSAGLVDRIATQLQSEPAVLAPPRWHPTRHKVLRVAGSLAIAASVAAVAVVGVQFLQTGPVIDGASSPPLAQGPAAPQERIDAGERHLAAGQTDAEGRLNLYMVEHNEFSPSSSIKGMMSYGRVVSYENER
jgi:negative regulator of sigma E activity